MTTENQKIETSKIDMLKIHLKDIVQNDDENGRFITGEDIEQLAESILKDGQDTPVHVKRLPNNAGFKLISGNRRFKAIQLINSKLPEDQHMMIKAIPVRQNDQEMILSNIRENVERKELTVMDQAIIANRLIDRMNYNQTQVAATLHVTPAWVSQILNLLSLNYDTQVQVHRGNINATDAIEMARSLDTDEQRKVVAAINIAEAEAKTKEAESAPAGKAETPRDKAAKAQKVQKAAKAAGKQALASAKGSKGYTVPASKREVKAIDPIGKRNPSEMREFIEMLMDASKYSKKVRTVASIILDGWDGKIREDKEFETLLVSAIDEQASAGVGA